MKPSDVLAFIAGSLLAVSVYTFLAGWLMGGSPAVAGMVGAAFVGLLGVVAGGSFVEALILTTIMSGVVGAVFGLTSPPPVIGHAVLALASGVAGGQLIAAVHDALVPTRYDAEHPRPAVSVPTRKPVEPRQRKSAAPRAPKADRPSSMGGSFASKPAGASAPDTLPGGPSERVPGAAERPTEDTAPVEPGAGDPDPDRSPIAEFTEVQFVRIESFDRWWTAGVDELARPPQVGDEGIVVDVPEDPDGHYTVEVIDDADRTICTTEARRSELRVR